MKKLMFALPAIALFATAAVAQTDTTGGTTGTDGTDAATGMNATGQSYGTNWPLSVGTTFFSDATSSTLRSTEELDSGWQSLAQEDRDMILADCETFMAAHGGDTAGESGTMTTEGSAGTSSSATTGNSTESGTAATTTEGVATATGDASATTGVDAATTAPTGYDMAQMRMICAAAGNF